MLEYFGKSDVGLVRLNNEDVFDYSIEHNFFTLADGMGGHKAGEIASKEATSALIIKVKDHFTHSSFSKDKILHYIKNSIEHANQTVFDLSSNHEQYKGMGTTLCCMHLYDNFLTYAHVGDSRIYHFREDNIFQLTEDHSLVDKSDELMRFHPMKHIITKAIGSPGPIDPSIAIKQFQKDDIFFMCSDGLCDFVTKDEMSFILRNSNTVQESVNKLIQAAKVNKSNDNITVMMVKIK
jgi:PPM family protein phosphatase